MQPNAETGAVDDGLIARARRFFTQDLWALDLRPGSAAGWALRMLQLGVMIGRGFVKDELLMRASSLTYVTTLSIMPLLVVMFAVVGMVGGDQTMVNFVVEQLTIVSPEAREVILERLGAINIGSLGTVGATLFLVTAVLALRHLETALNEIWGVVQSRSWMRRFSDYLTVLMVAPILTAAALSLATTLQSEPLVEYLLGNPNFARLYNVGLVQLPKVLFVVAFSFLYAFFPNTHVKLTSALLGGIVATALFSMARYAYVDLSVGAARYNVLFGSMVALPLILVWLYICWAVILFGAEVAFAYQNLGLYRREVRGESVAPAERESVGLRIAVEIGRSFRAHETPPSGERLSEDLGVPVRMVREILVAFERAGLIAASGKDDRDPGYLPARPLGDIKLLDLLVAMRGTRIIDAESVALSARTVAVDRVVDGLLDQLDGVVADFSTQRSLADMLPEQPTG
jgi:membrane protein